MTLRGMVWYTQWNRLAKMFCLVGEEEEEGVLEEAAVLDFLFRVLRSC